jgi:hypothetical protein
LPRNLRGCPIPAEDNAPSKSKYGSKVSVKDPGFLGSVLVSCETPELNVDALIREFDIERLDDYFSRALQHRQTHIEP